MTHSGVFLWFCGAVPHVMDPAYTGATGHYLNLGECYDRKALFPMREQLVKAVHAYKECYVRAYQCLAASGEVRCGARRPLLTAEAREKAAKRAKGILSRELRGKKEIPGSISHRCLGAVTCKGMITGLETAYLQCRRIYELQDGYGLASFLLEPLLKGAVSAGYDVVACWSPEFPDSLQHLLIPELSLAFLTTEAGVNLEKRPYRRIRMSTFLDKELLRTCRTRLRFADRIADELRAEGILALGQSKENHDKLEDIYHPYVNFRLMQEMADGLTEEIMELP